MANVDVAIAAACRLQYRVIVAAYTWVPTGFFATGATRALGNGSPPVGSRGKAAVAVWGQCPENLTAYC